MQADEGGLLRKQPYRLSVSQIQKIGYFQDTDWLPLEFHVGGKGNLC